MTYYLIYLLIGCLLMVTNKLGNFIIIPPEKNLKHQTLAVIGTLIGIIIQIHIWPLILYMLHSNKNLEDNMTRVPLSHCTNCGKPNNGSMASNHYSSGPHPGDVCICVGCASINVYDEELKMRAPTMKELHDMSDDESVRHAQEMVKLMNSMKE